VKEKDGTIFLVDEKKYVLATGGKKRLRKRKAKKKPNQR